MDRADVTEHIDLVAKRVEFLEALDDAPRHKPALVDALGHSRSTVDRAVRRLEAVGFLTRTDEGFRTTLAGRLAAAAHRSFLAEADTVLDGVGILGALPPDCDLPRAVVRESRIETFETPARAFEATVEPLRTADRYVAFLPRLRDSRQLRLCHARVRTGMAAELLVAPSVLERLETEFPRLAADLAVADGVTVYRVDESRAYALSLSHGQASTVTVAPTDEDATGVLTATAAPAVAWAESTFADLRENATDVTDRVAAMADDLDETLLGRYEQRGAADLADIGVERLGATTFSGRTPNDPATGWRVGFDLVDAYYGHPFERHHPEDDAPRADAESGDTDEHPRAVDHLVETLGRGRNTAVVGPPGTGKSTLCRQVACRWIGGDHGPVFYRATPTETAFDRPDLLTAALDDCDGHALVVVEDGDDESTVERLVPVVERARDDPNVSLLVESQASTWPPTSADPRADDLLRSTVDEYRLGPATRAECRDAVAAFEAATGRAVPVDGDQLFEAVADSDGPGDCSLLGYLLAATTTPSPWTDTADEPTGLDADARAGYALVAPDGPDDTLALEVGLLAALSTAVNRRVTPAALHTVAVVHAGGEVDRASAHRRVEAAIDDLRGVLLFDNPDGEGFRTQHPYWAVRFLDAALADNERTTVDAFERALSALFAAADDPAVREQVETWFGRRVDGLDPDETDVDATVTELFGVVRRYTSLVPLFGTTEFSGIALPDACSPETRLEARAARLFGWYKYGDLDRTVAEAEGLLAAVDAADVDAETAARFTVQARRRLADVADDRGDPATAREHLEVGLATAREVSDRRGETRLRTSLGMVELHADDYEAAEAALQEADRVGEPLGACPERSATVYYLGRLHRKRGEFAAAETRFREARDIDRECDIPLSDEAATLNALGTVAVDRGAFDRAERYYRRALERQRMANNTRGVATALVNLGDLAVETGDVATAEACFEESRALAAEVEAAVVHGAALSGLGRVATARGEFETAASYHRERMDIDGSPRTRATATRYLGDVAAEAGDVETARSRYEEAFEAYVEVGAADRAAATALDLVELRADAGATADARTWLERAEELVDDADLDAYREETASWADQLAPD